NIEQQIEDAVNDLSQEELDSEVDEETLLNIVAKDIDSLTTRDLKLAIGEEVEDEIEIPTENIEKEEILEENTNIPQEIETTIEDTVTQDNDGVTQLKALLEALSDKNVAASLKGMKININITLGDN
ncbi:MAG: DNA topoisomerase IV, partial [Campylobacterota bacterium]|nr:DNA topoisomerase IV [Campylobacterota bacterium]